MRRLSRALGRRYRRPVRRRQCQRAFSSNNLNDFEFSDDEADQGTLSVQGAFLANSPYDIRAAMVMERIAVLVPEMQPWEAEWERVESEWNLKYGKELPAFMRFKRFFTSIKEEDFVGTAGTPGPDAPRMGYDPWDEVQQYYGMGDRVSDADRSNDVRSLERARDRSVYLLTQQEGENGVAWDFPSARWEPGEALRDTARRLIRGTVGSGMEHYQLGNGPIGHYRYLYDESRPRPSSSDANKIGCITFYLHTLHVDGTVELPHMRKKKTRKVGSGAHLPADFKEVDYAWVTKAELPTYCGEDNQDFLTVCDDMLLTTDGTQDIFPERREARTRVAQRRAQRKAEKKGPGASGGDGADHVRAPQPEAPIVVPEWVRERVDVDADLEDLIGSNTGAISSSGWDDLLRQHEYRKRNEK